MEQSKKPPRSYKDLKQKQKTKISDYMYLETQDFFQTNGRMPDTDEDCKAVAQKVFNHLSGLRVPTEEIHAVYLRKRPHIIERLTIFGMPGHIRSHAEIKELQRIRAERKAHTKRRKKRAKNEPKLPPMEQDDTFFFIAGYTSGGAPYGLTWEEMELEPWEDIEQCVSHSPHKYKQIKVSRFISWFACRNGSPFIFLWLCGTDTLSKAPAQGAAGRAPDNRRPLSCQFRLMAAR